MAACRSSGARLVIARLGRLSRSAHVLLELQRADVRFVAADMPEANELTVGIMAVIAQAEREAISTRIRAALQAARARGTKLGGYRGGPAPDGRRGAAGQRARADAFAARVAPTILELRACGLSLHQIAAELTARSVHTAKGASWRATTVARILTRTASGGPSQCNQPADSADMRLDASPCSSCIGPN